MPQRPSVFRARRDDQDGARFAELDINDDLDGGQAEVLFGVLGAASKLNDHEGVTEMFRIYNDWLADSCRPDRLTGSPACRTVTSALP